MTDARHCPVDGCDYGESDDKSLPAVRAHINASGDDAHDWDELRETVEQQGEQPEADENEEEDMPTDEEYREQYEDGEDDGDQTPNDSSSSGGMDLPIPELSPMAWACVLVALVVLYFLLVRDSSGAVEQADTTEDGGDSDAVTEEEVTLVE